MVSYLDRAGPAPGILVGGGPDMGMNPLLLRPVNCSCLGHAVLINDSNLFMALTRAGSGSSISSLTAVAGGCSEVAGRAFGSGGGALAEVHLFELDAGSSFVRAPLGARLASYTNRSSP